MGILFLPSCARSGRRRGALEAKIDSLQRRLDDAYRPGLGEFMSGIQVHHAKLWFAGNAQNWKLADFEVGEIRETLERMEEEARTIRANKTLEMIHTTHALYNSPSLSDS